VETTLDCIKITSKYLFTLSEMWKQAWKVEQSYHSMLVLTFNLGLGGVNYKGGTLLSSFSFSEDADQGAFALQVVA